MLIPYQRLSREALAAIIDEYILREGTDYGSREKSLDEKRTRLRTQLERGEVVISFDARTNSCTMVPARDADATSDS